MRTNLEEISLMCFDKIVEDKLLAKVDNNTSRDDMIKIVQEIDSSICSCSECGSVLEWGEDGYMTTWGTCDDCVEDGMEELEQCE